MALPQLSRMQILVGVGVASIIGIGVIANKTQLGKNLKKDATKKKAKKNPLLSGGKANSSS